MSYYAASDKKYVICVFDTETQAEDVEAMAKLEQRGISPVIVPDNDPDHR